MFSFGLPSTRKDSNVLECVKQRATKMVKGAGAQDMKVDTEINGLAQFQRQKVERGF